MEKLRQIEVSKLPQVRQLVRSWTGIRTQGLLAPDAMLSTIPFVDWEGIYSTLGAMIKIQRGHWEGVASI